MSSIRARTLQFHEQFATELDDEWLNSKIGKLISEKRIGVVKSFVGECKNKKIIEFGCGFGRIINSFDSKSNLCVGLDYNINAIRFAKKNSNVFFVVGDADTPPFKDNVFDVIIMSELLEHMPDRDRTLSEGIRITKNMGFIFASTPNKLSPYSLIKPIVELIPKYNNPINNYYSMKSLERLLKKHNIKILRRLNFGFLHPFFPKKLIGFFVAMECILEKSFFKYFSGWIALYGQIIK